MGVDFYTCSYCEDTFADCGPFKRCGGDTGGCGRIFCNEKCLCNDGAEWARWDEETETWIADAEHGDTLICSHCLQKDASDCLLLQLALQKLGTTRETLIAEYYASQIPSYPSPPSHK